VGRVAAVQGRIDDDRCLVCRRPFAEHRIFHDVPLVGDPGRTGEFIVLTTGVYCPTNIPSALTTPPDPALGVGP
jgi:hypothetical protein